MKNRLILSILPLALLSGTPLLFSAATLEAPSSKNEIAVTPPLASICLTCSGEVSAVIADGIYFEGLEVPGNVNHLRNSLLAYLGKPIDADTVRDIKREVIAFYQQNNYPFVSVQIPEQEVTDGRLKLIVSASKLGKVNVSGNRYFSSERYRNAIRIRHGEPINERTILNNVNYLNRNPFRVVDLVYSEGESRHTTDLDLIVKDRYPLTGYVGVDNTGLQHIERTRLFGGLTWGNVFGCDQILTVQYSMAPEIHKFFAITGSYIIPLPIQHVINLYGGYSRVHAHVPSSTHTAGYSSQASLRYTVPLTAASGILQECFAGFDFKRYNNTVEFVEITPVFGQTVDLTQFLGGYNFGYETGRHKLGFDFQLVFSPFQWLPDQSNADFESLNPFARHTYVYGRLAINYKVLLPGRWYWTVYAAGQLTNITLLPSEQLGIGGYSTVRGYEERQLNADDGVYVQTEFLTPKIKFPKNLQDKRTLRTLEFLAFLDYGFAHDRHQYGGEGKNEYLLGVGPGVRFSIGRYFLARCDWGIKLHRDHFPGGWSMLHFSVMGSF